VASDGNAELGGKDWDDRLLNHVAEQFVEKHRRPARRPAAVPGALRAVPAREDQPVAPRIKAVIPVNYQGHRMVVPR
jgi:molecular chaperone DnaK